MPEGASLDGTVGLAMYPFDRLRPAWQEFWSLVQQRVPWLPPGLTWHEDLHAAWRSPDLLIDQTCGWPLVTELAEIVRVVGAFEYDVPQADGHTYRSVIVARTAGVPAEFAGACAAVNADDSLSGWVSLVAAVHGPASRWAGPVRWTGAHVDSVRAVRDGSADVASIDAVTWAYLRRLHPDTVDGLYEIGLGPRVPSLPVIAARRLDDDQITHVRAAFAEALRDPVSADLRRSLLVRRFVPLELADYRPLLDLAPVSRAGR